jgi:DNA invertase Pin-like site-specific DNA recombinase
MPKIWPYGRASTDKQIITPKAQQDRIQLFDKYQRDSGSWDDTWLLGDFLCDSDVSGTIPFRLREYGNVIFTQVQAGDVIVAADFDRAFRNVQDFLDTMGRLNQRNVGIIVLDLGRTTLDTTNPASKAMLTTLAAFKVYEIENRKKRITDAVNLLRKTRGVLQGNKLGWKLVPKPGDTRAKPEKIAVPNTAHRKVGAWLVQQIDVEGWGFRQCWRHLWHDPKTRFCLGKRQEISEWHVRTLYKLCKAGWPKTGDSDGASRHHARPCFDTTAS